MLWVTAHFLAIINAAEDVSSVVPLRFAMTFDPQLSS